MNNRTTSLESINLSSGQLLLGRRPRKNLPTRTELLKPRNTGPNLNQQMREMRDIKEKQKFYFDMRHVKELPCLDIGGASSQSCSPWKLKYQRMETSNSSRDPQTAKILHRQTVTQTQHETTKTNKYCWKLRTRTSTRAEYRKWCRDDISELPNTVKHSPIAVRIVDSPKPVITFFGRVVKFQTAYTSELLRLWTLCKLLCVNVFVWKSKVMRQLYFICLCYT